MNYGARPATAVPGPKSTAKPSGPVDAWMASGTQKSSLFPATNFVAGSTTEAPRKRVIPKATAKNDDMDELEDLMGGGDKLDDSLFQKQKAEVRDTLGFLKKSEEEKKRKEEEKKLALS